MHSDEAEGVDLGIEVRIIVDCWFIRVKNGYIRFNLYKITVSLLWWSSWSEGKKVLHKVDRNVVVGYHIVKR